MSKQTDHAQLFQSLHIKGNPVILYNVWDAGSAKAVAAAGAKAIATGSAPVAMAQGFADGENIPLDLVLGNLSRIIAAVDLPVSTDIEGGYGGSTDVVAQTVTRSIETGAIGFNFEDQIVGTAELYDLPTQISRITAARLKHTRSKCLRMLSPAPKHSPMLGLMGSLRLALRMKP